MFKKISRSVTTVRVKQSKAAQKIGKMFSI